MCFPWRLLYDMYLQTNRLLSLLTICVLFQVLATHPGLHNHQWLILLVEEPEIHHLAKVDICDFKAFSKRRRLTKNGTLCFRLGSFGHLRINNIFMSPTAAGIFLTLRTILKTNCQHDHVTHIGRLHAT